MNLGILKDLVILLAVAVLIIYVSRKIKLPPVVGFLLTGILIGPGGLSLVRDINTIGVLAEIGVIMLLFMIGLKFTLDRLKRIQRNFWLGGGIQVLMTISAAVFILVLLRVGFREAVFYGFLVSLSSTAIVLKILSDRGETDTPQGGISLGILIFQDLAIVPMIALVPILTKARAASPVAFLVRFLEGGVVITFVFLAARYLMPRLLYLVVRTRIREVFLIASLFICLGMALLTSSLGLSLALGAFLAGVGWNSRDKVMALVLSILVLKAVIVVLTVRLLGYSPRIAIIAGLTLAQIGEFSFVLAGVGRANGILQGAVFLSFLASSVLTILATPFLIQVSPSLAARVKRIFGWQGGRAEKKESPAAAPGNHIIIARYGLNGRNLAHVLKEAGVRYTILELNPETVRRATEEGEPIVFGDVSSRTILDEARVKEARGIVFAISDPATTRRGVRAARDMNPRLFMLVRTRNASEIDELTKLEANDVIPEEFETSLEIFTRVLDKYHVPRNIIDAQIRMLRGECSGMLRGTCEAIRPNVERIADLLAAGTPDTFYVAKAAWFCGSKLMDSDIRKKTGATVVAVVRGEASHTSPGAEFRLESGGTLGLVASHRDMDRAFQFLTSGETE